MFRLDFMFVKPHAVPHIFCLNAQTDYYNGHPRQFADELPVYLGWIHVGIGKRLILFICVQFQNFSTFIK